MKKKGLYQSLYSIYWRGAKPILHRRILNKYRNISPVISDSEFFSLLDLKGKKLSPVRGYLKKNDLAGAKKELINYYRGRSTPQFFFNPSDIGKIRDFYLKNFSSESVNTLKIADEILSHKFNFYAPNSPSFGTEINWHSSFSDERNWPLDFFAELDYSSDNRCGDVREVWELNRHQYFTALGKAFMITGDEKYSVEFCHQFTDWIKRNPLGYGINWLHSQETGLRLVSWIWAFHFFMNSVRFDDNLKIGFLKSLYRHAEYTLLTRSRGFITHNHLISEICAVAIFSMVFPEFKSSVKWLKISGRIFLREVAKQIWESGPSAELSTNYHFFVTDSFLQVLILMRKNKIRIPPDIEKRIEKMIEYGMYIMKPDGTIPKLGDNDSGRAVKLSETDTDDRRSYLSSGAVLFNSENFKFVSRKFYEESFWLLGIEGFDRYKEIQSGISVAPSGYFENTGIAVFRKDWNSHDYLVFRGGPTRLRNGVSISHNHADFLSFEYRNNKIDYFVDPGTYKYSEDDKWRFLYRQTKSHNTILVDGRDSAEVTASRFGLPELPLSTLNKVDLNDSYAFIDMTHSGYGSRQIFHRRKLIYFYNADFLIIDMIYGGGNHLINQVFNLDKNDIEIHADMIGIKSGSSDSVFLHSIGGKSFKTGAFKGIHDPPYGWVSYRYGTRHPANMLNLTSKVDLPFIFGTYFEYNNRSNFKLLNYRFEIERQSLKFERDCSIVEITFSENNIDLIKKEKT